MNKDNINPSHYKQGKVECIEALESATVNKKGMEAVCTSNVIKYLWRYEDKNGLEDVIKAKWYLDKLIKTLEEKIKVNSQPLTPDECFKVEKDSFPLEGQFARGNQDGKIYHIAKVEQGIVFYNHKVNKGSIVPDFSSDIPYFKEGWSLWKQEDS